MHLCIDTEHLVSTRYLHTFTNSILKVTRKVFQICCFFHMHKITQTEIRAYTGRARRIPTPTPTVCMYTHKRNQSKEIVHLPYMHRGHCIQSAYTIKSTIMQTFTNICIYMSDLMEWCCRYYIVLCSLWALVKLLSREAERERELVRMYGTYYVHLVYMQSYACTHALTYTYAQAQHKDRDK